jgi:hypothetical protein
MASKNSSAIVFLFSKAMYEILALILRTKNLKAQYLITLWML